MIADVNVSLSRWPFRRLPHDEFNRFLTKLRACGVTQAWAGSFDGLLHKDIRAVNARLANACLRGGPDFLLPFGSINPTLPDWREDLRRCRDPVMAELLTLAERSRLIVQLVMRVEDPRMQHPLMRVPDVDAAPLPKLVADRPRLQLVILNGLQLLRESLRGELIAAGRVYLEIATLEKVGGVAGLLSDVPLERVLFGSHFPYFILESPLLKLRESELTPSQISAITHENAARLMDERDD